MFSCFLQARKIKQLQLINYWCSVKICTIHYKSIGVKYFWRLLQQRGKETDGRWKRPLSVTGGASVASTPGLWSLTSAQHSEGVHEHQARRPLWGRFIGLAAESGGARYARTPGYWKCTPLVCCPMKVYRTVIFIQLSQVNILYMAMMMP